VYRELECCCYVYADDKENILYIAYEVLWDNLSESAIYEADSDMKK
jgi:hypothetical protein